jgi:hypothetical protein
MSDSDLLTCPKCQKTYKASSFKRFGYEKCKDCKVFLEDQETLRRKASERGIASGKALEAKKSTAIEIETELNPQQELVAAQDRTTRAVRALAVFFFSSLRSGMVGTGLVGLGLLCFGSAKDFGVILMVAGWLVAFIGFFVAFFRGSEELRKSELPKY